MGEIFREIVINKRDSWCDPRTISTEPAMRPLKIDYIVVINNTSPTKMIRIGLMTSKAEADKNPIKDWSDVGKDTPESITATVNLKKGDSIYATFTEQKNVQI